MYANTVAARKVAGLCIETACGRPCDGTKLRCKEHLEAARKHDRARYAARKAAGKCVQCGRRPATSGYVRCAVCRVSHNAIDEEHRRYCKEQRLCSRCPWDHPEPICDESVVFCAKHLLEEKETGQLRARPSKQPRHETRSTHARPPEEYVAPARIEVGSTCEEEPYPQYPDGYLNNRGKSMTLGLRRWDGRLGTRGDDVNSASFPIGDHE
jgi:hypothetical protein